MCTDRVLASYPKFTIGVSNGFVTVTVDGEVTYLPTPEAEYLADEFMDLVMDAGRT